MKKSYFLMAAAAAMFAACSETEVLNVAQESAPKAIAFETYAGSATRVDPTAENSGMPFSPALEAHHDDFLVWGYKNTATDYVFENVKVSYAGGWSYYQAGIQNYVYWDKAANSYEFYAAAPATTATPSFWTLNENSDASQADDYFTTAEFTVAAHNIATGAASATGSFKGAATDLMIANKETVTSIGSDVQLDFMHILSRLNITVATSLSNTVKLVSLTVNGLGATASFDESNVADPSTGTYRRWGSKVASIWTEGVTTGSVTYTALADQPVNATAKYVLEALVMPQAAAHETITITQDGEKPFITISYTIDDEPFTAKYNLAAAFGVTSGNTLAFNEGWQNTLNITIGASAIQFSGTVAQWKDTSKNYTVGNN